MEQDKQKDKSKFNPNQSRAVFTTDTDILVSAGAGCGKTFVMIERIAENIISHKVSVDELLVVTYTNAAASEMRVKLANKINELLADPTLDEEQKSYLHTQADLIGQSDICTLHKFCQNLIQKYFYVLDLDPSCAICEESEASILRTRAINSVIEKLIAEDNPQFKLLANTFDDKRGYDKIHNYVFKIYEFLNNQPDIEQFKAKVNSAYNADLNHNKFANIINKSTVELFQHFERVFTDLKNQCIQGGLTRLVEVLDEYLSILRGVNSQNDFYQNHRLVFAISLRALPRTSISPEDDEMKTQISEAKKAFATGLNAVKANYITSDIEKLKTDLMGSQQIVNAMFMLVEKFRESFSNLKKEHNLMDFSDLEKYAYQILKDPVVGREIRERYKQIYVDEYQDVNDIQEGILSLIHKSRDIFLVGDVKQSIYGFRNTNPQIFLDKLYSFGQESNDSAIAIPLNENYRSDQRILDYVNFVFGVLMTKDFAGIDYLPDHAMRSGAKYLPVSNGLPIVEVMIINKTKDEVEKNVPTEVYKVSTAPLKEDLEKSYARAEAYAIFNKIMQLLTQQKQIYDAKKRCFRDIEFGDITILARSRTGGVPKILEELSNLGLPMAPLSGDSVIDEYEVQILLDYLKLIYDRTDDIALTALLVSPVVGVDEEELANIRLFSPQCDAFWECVSNYSQDDEVKQKIDFCLQLIEEGRKNLINGSIFDTLNKFIKKTTYLYKIGFMEDGAERVARVNGYVNSFLGKKYNFDLVEYLENVEENNGEIDVSKEPNADASVIGFATMHQSKGLEYPIVFMVDCGHQYNTEDKRGDFLLNSELGMGMFTYDNTTRTKRKTILHSAVRLATKDKDLAERERLLYVAMTRAKNHLYISGALNMEKFKSFATAYALKNVQNDLSLILSSVQNEDLDKLRSLKKLTQELTSDNIIEYSLLPAESVVDEVNIGSVEENSCKVDADFVDLLRKNQQYAYPYQQNIGTRLKNSVTALNRLAIANNGITFDLENGILVDESKDGRVDTATGIAFHKAMQYIDFNLDTELEIREFLSKILNKDELEMVDCGKILRAVQNLRPIIQDATLYREQHFIMKVPLNVILDTSVTDEVIVEGVIDLIAVKNDEIIIIDYKTSNAQDLDATAKHYYTQLQCYAEAVKGAFGRSVAQKFLYFFLQERLILIDND